MKAHLLVIFSLLATISQGQTVTFTSGPAAYAKCLVKNTATLKNYSLPHLTSQKKVLLVQKNIDVGWIDKSISSLLPDSNFIKKSLAEGSSFSWCPVLAPTLVSKQFIYKIIGELKSENYLPHDFDEGFTKEAQTALFKFQNDFDLPIGNFNLPTLDYLGLSFEREIPLKKIKLTREKFPYFQQEKDGDFRIRQGDFPPNREEGKCYVKSMIPEHRLIYEFELPVYTGSPHNKKLKRKKVKVAGTKIEIVKKPQKVEPGFFKWTVFTEEFFIEGGHSEWREILCAPQITEEVIRNVLHVLQQEGYDISSHLHKKALDKEVRRALKHFQVRYGLPVGNLNTETLHAMGIKF